MRADQMLQALVAYDKVVRRNGATEAVAYDEDGEVPWEIMSTAQGEGFEFTDADWQEFFTLASEYRRLLRVELERRADT